MEYESVTSFSTTVVSESVYQFIRGMCWGAVWGLVTPSHAPGTVEAKRGTKA